MLRFLLCWTPTAHALDTDSYDPSGATFDGAGGLQLQMPRIGPAGSGYGGLQAGWAMNPLVARWSDGTEEPVVSDVVVTHLLGGYNLFGVARLDLDVPLYPYVGRPGGGPAGPPVGPLRIGGVVRALGSDRFALAVAPTLAVPMGQGESYVQGAGVSGGVTLAAQVDPSDTLFAAVNLGVVGARPEELGDASVGTSLRVGAGAGWRATDRFLFGLEATASVGFDGSPDSSTSPVEAHAYGTWHAGSGFHAVLAGGTGLVAGIGSPDVRIVAGAGYRWDGAGDDRDDAVVDTNVGGIVDADGDGIADPDDACPGTPGPASAGGCPDADGDQVTDEVDGCPRDPGAVAAKGCPDRDGDGVADGVDRCPDVTGPPATAGCPPKATLGDGRITIADQVNFELAKAVIVPGSYPVLDEVASLLRAHPEVRRIEVSGHTDSDGDDDLNQQLSQERAEAVVQYLVSQGKIEPSRLIAIGYGEALPMDTNATPEGRARNRRVEFTVIEEVPTTAPTPPG